MRQGRIGLARPNDFQSYCFGPTLSGLTCGLELERSDSSRREPVIFDQYTTQIRQKFVCPQPMSGNSNFARIFLNQDVEVSSLQPQPIDDIAGMRAAP